MSGSDNFRREVGALKKRVGTKREDQHYCYHCGQPLRGQRHAELIAERIAEEAKKAREDLIKFIEKTSAHLNAATARERARRGAERLLPAEVVQHVEGADVREEKPRDDEGEPMPGELVARVEDDPVLAAIRKRRDERLRARERATRAVRPTIVNQEEENNGDD